MLTPDQQRALDDALKRRNLFHNTNLTPDQQIMAGMLQSWEKVTNQVVRPLLKALPTPSAYSSEGTFQLLKQSFLEEVSSYSKEQLQHLVAIMHAEELEKQAHAMADAGLCGPDMDKPI